jgi:CBS domain-containing protein
LLIARQMVIDEVIEFLHEVSPFQELDKATLREIAAGISVELYPAGSTILYQDGPASEYLRIIKKGSVKVFIKPGMDDKVAIDTRGEGESFGFLSLLGGDKSRANVVATEDTICYLISKDSILRLLEAYPAFLEYFLAAFLNKYLDKTYGEISKRSLLYDGGDRLLFTTPVGELVTKKVITAPEEISVKEAAEIMSRNNISSIVLVDPDDIPAGIVTDRDLRDKVISKDRSVRDPIHTIMSRSLIKADAGDYCFEALLKMIRYNIHHVLIIENGRLKGVATNHDLMMLQGTSPISIAREIESQQSIEGLAPVSVKINKIIGLLLKEGAKAGNISRIISEINDRLLRKVIEITEKQFGAPPVSYCWIVLGSEGRKEQTFKTDQDNAIIYADPEKSDDAEKIRKYFSAFSLSVRDGLVKCGFPLCPADYMASNPLWCQPLRQWKKYFSTWIYTPTPEAVLNSLIFLDFRPVHGDFGLSDSLRSSIAAMLEGQMIFLGYMANTIIKNTPPVGFFGSLIVEKSGEHKDKLNLKIKGIAPFVDMGRLFSLEKGIQETSTVERINALRDRHTIVKAYADEFEEAFEFLMLLRIRHQYEQLENGKEPDNFLDPGRLSNLEKRKIKEAFRFISKMQDIIIERYKPLIW